MSIKLEMYKYYNANPLGRIVNDCTVRAIALATEQSWDATYRELSDFAREQGITFSEIEFINKYLEERYKHYCFAEKITTLKDFLNLNLPGRWLVTMSGHITCVINGVCYDTFDPSNRYIWCVYKVKEGVE